MEEKTQLTNSYINSPRITMYMYVYVLLTVMCKRLHVSYSVSADTQIKEENFLEDIGNLLNTGEVPNMFPIDEKNEICSKMRQIDK